MTEKGKNTPTVRFKGFTDDWEQRKLGEIVTEVNRTDEKSVAPVMMITAENGFIRQSERYAYNNSGKSLKKYIILKYGELAYNHGASKLRPYGSCFALTTEKEARIPFVYHCFAANHDNARYLSLVLNGEAVAKQLKRIVSSGARMDGLLNISFEDYETIPIMLPSKEEQDTIVDYFIYFDHLIALHQRQLDEQKALKKYFLQNMFPAKGEKVPRIRFQGFTGDWEQRKLDDVVSFYSGLTYTPNDVRKDGTLVLRSSNVKDGEIVSSDDVFVDSSKVNSNNVEEGDIIVVVRNGSRALIGKHAQIKHLMSNTVIGAFMTGIRSNVPEFINAMLDTSRFKKEIDRNMGATINQITGHMFSKMIFSVPTDDEKKKIGGFFKALDNLIALHQRQLTQLQAVKKFMLQNLFV